MHVLRVETDQAGVAFLNALRSLPTLLAEHAISLRRVLGLAAVNLHNKVFAMQPLGRLFQCCIGTCLTQCILRDESV